MRQLRPGGMRLSQAGAPAFPGQEHRHAVEDHWCERIGWMCEWASEGYPQTDAGFAANRRVQFMILKVPADKVASDEFDL